MPENTERDILNIMKGALEKEGYGVSFEFETTAGNTAFNVSDVDTGKIIRTVVVKKFSQHG